MALSRKLFVNWHTRKRLRSDISGAPDVADTLTFAKYETVPFEIVLVEPDPTKVGPNNFRRVDVTDLSLKVTINDTQDDAAPLVEQSTWSKNANDSTFSGSLVLNTAAMNTYMSEDREPYFEIEVTDSTGNRVKVLTEPCDVIVGVAQVTTVSPDPEQEYYTKAEVIGLFFPRRGGPGETLTLVSPDGSHERVLGMRDDGTPQDDYV